MFRHSAIALIIAIGIGSQSHAVEPAVTPNIVLFMADDMGLGDTSAYQDFTGNADDVQLHTPQMERLARTGIRFTDAHTPSSRCTSTRYGLLTGRYPWRSRLKHWVLFGAQGDPLIEPDRPTLATMLREHGYATAMVGKWHVGLRYRQSDGSPAAGWHDADLTKPLLDSPVDHGFNYARFTSRSHGTSGPHAGRRNQRALPKESKQNNVGPGHIHGRMVVGATENGRQLVSDGPNAYVLSELGGRHSEHAVEFLEAHVSGATSSQKPFFLYYASNANHGPYTPDHDIDGVPVAGAARTKSDKAMDARHDFIYENDVALGRLLDWLEQTDDPRNPEHKLIETTLVIFTSDNGAERNSNMATGPFRSHKGSVFEGGHRVPFIVSWPAGGIGQGVEASKGVTSAEPIGLQDMFATFAELAGATLPELRQGEKGAEDSVSVLAAFRGESLTGRPPLFFNDHKEAGRDHAAVALRLDSPTIGGQTYQGKWKLFFAATLLRAGEAQPYALYNLAADQQEQTNLIDKPDLVSLVDHLTDVALVHRTVGGHRQVELAAADRITFDWSTQSEQAHRLAKRFGGQPVSPVELDTAGSELTLTIAARQSGESLLPAKYRCNANGLGISTGESPNVNAGEALLISFDQDVIVESAAIVAATGSCGGFYQLGEHAPLAIYCTDADNDSNNQQGIISDMGLLPAGEVLRLDSSPHYGVEAVGSWRLKRLVVRRVRIFE